MPPVAAAAPAAGLGIAALIVGGLIVVSLFGVGVFAMAGGFDMLQTSLGLRTPIEDAARFMPEDPKGFVFIGVQEVTDVMGELDLLDEVQLGEKEDKIMDILGKVDWVAGSGSSIDTSSAVVVLKVTAKPEELIKDVEDLAETDKIGWKSEDYKGVKINRPYDKESSDEEPADGGYYFVGSLIGGNYVVIGTVDSLEDSIDALKEGDNAIEWVKEKTGLLEQKNGAIFLAGESDQVDVVASVSFTEGTVASAEIVMDGEAATSITDSLEGMKSGGSMPFDFDFEISKKEGRVRVVVSELDLKDVKSYAQDAFGSMSALSLFGGGFATRSPMPYPGMYSTPTPYPSWYATPTPTQVAGGATTISSCPYTISSPGTYTVKSGGITSASGTCITLTTGSSGAVLDCGYNPISSSAYEGFGVYINSGTGITVRNCFIHGFARGIGVQADFGSVGSETFTGNIISDNPHFGIIINDAAGNVVSGNTVSGASGDGYGGAIHCGGGCRATFTDNTVCSNTAYDSIHCDVMQPGSGNTCESTSCDFSCDSC